MTQDVLTPVQIDEAAQPSCQHFWVIQPATGPESSGTCRACGETRAFKNYVEGAAWGDARLANRTDALKLADVQRVTSAYMNVDSDE